MLALVEGRLAGLGAALRLGRAKPGQAEGQRALAARLARLNRFWAGLERVFAPPASYLDLLTEGTVVCRCEEVTYGELSVRLAEDDPAGAAMTGMGPTQGGDADRRGALPGRNCLATLAAIVARARGLAVDDLTWPRVRPPARPIPSATCCTRRSRRPFCPTTRTGRAKRSPETSSDAGAGATSDSHVCQAFKGLPVADGKEAFRRGCYRPLEPRSVSGSA